MIRFCCPNCGHKFSAPDDYAGKRSKCPKCSAPILVPESSQEPGQDTSDLIKFRCGNCGRKIGVPVDYAGRRVKCTKCGQPCKVPESQPRESSIEVETPAEVSQSDDMTGGNIWNGEALTVDLEAGLPVQVERPEPSSSQLQTGSGVKCSRCGAMNSPDTQFCVTCATPIMTAAPSASGGGVARVVVEDIGRVPLAFAASIAFTFIGAAIWAWIASLFGVRWTAFLATVVGPLAGVGFALFIRQRSVWIGLVAMLIGFCGITSGKVFIAKWVVMPKLMHKFSRIVVLYKDEILSEQISAEIVQEALKDPKVMFALTLLQLAEDGEVEQNVAKELAFDRKDRGISKDTEKQREFVEKKVYSCLINWTVEEKEKVVRAQLPKVVNEFADRFMQTGFGIAIGFLTAFLGSFSCLDVMWIPVALWGAYKIGAGWD